MFVGNSRTDEQNLMALMQRVRGTVTVVSGCHVASMVGCLRVLKLWLLFGVLVRPHDSCTILACFFFSIAALWPSIFVE
jgi:hypothetical protein